MSQDTNTQTAPSPEWFAKAAAARAAFEHALEDSPRTTAGIFDFAATHGVRAAAVIKGMRPA